MLSIIIPVHNAAKYLRKCLESLSNQNSSDFEALLIENGSNDNSLAICEEFSKYDKRFHTYPIGKCNGPSMPRNFGLDVSNGDIIAFLDADDWLEPNYIEIVEQNIKDYDILFWGYQKEDILGNVLFLKQPNIKNLKSLKSTCIDLNDQDCFGYVCCKAIKRKCVDNIRFKEDINLFEDEVFTLTVLKNCKNVNVVSDILYHYVIDNPNAITEKIHNDIVYKCDQLFSSWKDFIDNKDNTFIEVYSKKKVKFCINYLIEHSNLNNKEFYKQLINSSFYKVVKKSNQKEFIYSNLFTLIYYVYKQRIKIFIRNFIHRKKECHAFTNIKNRIY